MSTMSAIGSGLDCRSHQLSSSIVPLTANSVATSAGGALAWGDVRFAAISRQMRNSSSRSFAAAPPVNSTVRSEEHTSELQSLMRNSYAVFCLKQKKKHRNNQQYLSTQNQKEKKNTYKEEYIYYIPHSHH